MTYHIRHQFGKYYLMFPLPNGRLIAVGSFYSEAGARSMAEKFIQRQQAKDSLTTLKGI